MLNLFKILFTMQINIWFQETQSLELEIFVNVFYSTKKRIKINVELVTSFKESLRSSVVRALVS